jgi:Metallo-beta-lactamase superfamily
MAEHVEVSLLYCGQGMTNWIEYFPTDTARTQNLPSMLVLVDLGGDHDAAADHIVDRIVAIKALKGSTPQIDTVVFSHQDQDHWSLIDSFLAKLKAKKITDLKVGEILRGGAEWKQGALDAVERLRAATTKKMVGEFPPDSTDYEGENSDIIKKGTCRVRLLIANAPCKLKSGGMRENGTSAVVVVEIGGQSVILPGDATWETMDAIEGTYAHKDKPKPCFGLSVPHHGSLRTSVKGYTKKKKVEKMGWQYVETFVDNIEAKQIGASSGYLNSHNHPMTEIIEAFELFATASDPLHYLQTFSFEDQAWEKPVRKTPVWTTISYKKKPPPPKAPKKTKRKRDDDDLEAIGQDIVFKMDSDGNALVFGRPKQASRETAEPPPAVAPAPSAAELAAHAARTAHAAG